MLGNKQFELSNLPIAIGIGNVLTTVSDRKLPHTSDNITIDYYTSDITSAQDYYAFGQLMPGRNVSSNEYKFGFNGKLNDDEVFGATGSFQDYGMRMYDTRVCRFISVDPVSGKFPWLSTYQFASNRPIIAIDLDGLEAYDAPNNSSVFSLYNWREFVKSYSNKLLSDQEIQKIDDKDCADLPVEMAAIYHKNMGVALSVTVRYENGTKITIDSNDPKYQDNTKKDDAGNMYSKFDWYLDDLKKAVGPNGIPQIAFNITSSTAGTGDIALLNNGSSFFHTQVLNDDFAEYGSNNGYIQASGHYYGRGNLDNSLASPLITTGPFDTNGWPYLYRFNFLQNVPYKTEGERPLKMQAKRVVLETKKSEIITK